LKTIDEVSAGMWLLFMGFGIIHKATRTKNRGKATYLDCTHTRELSWIVV
jgi:hypothetical protein